jgi:DNA-binding CsgD family transcriptional regulator
MLTAREIEVLRLLSQGCGYAEVAQCLGMSIHTVGSHIKNAYRKLSVRTAAAAVTRAAELGCLTLKTGGDLRDAG